MLFSTSSQNAQRFRKASQWEAQGADGVEAAQGIDPHVGPA